jgi:hypothetical protein
MSAPVFISTADAMCMAADRVFSNLKRLRRPTPYPVAQRIFETDSHAYAVAGRTFSKLTPPPSLKSAWDAYLRALKPGAPLFAHLAADARASNATAYARDARRSIVLEHVRAQALAGKGFQHCGTGH